jgi:mannose-6-phosphate isomerase-like protein (cupin superfamily)
MKRTTFIRLASAAITGLATPFTALAKTTSRVTKGFFVPSGKDRFDKSIHLFEGDTFFTKVSTNDTDGEFYVFESTRDKKGGPPLHVHHEQDEWWYILSGEFLIKVGDEVFTAKTGDSAFGPRGVPHTFAKVSEGEGRLLISFTPAGKMEESFIARSQGATDHMTDEQRKEFSRAHGVDIVGPPLSYLKQ